MTDNNDLMVLINGESGTGKSASLMNFENPETVMYLNCEAGKKLPFKSKFKEFKITDPYQVYEGLKHALDNPGKYSAVVIDTITFLMDMVETQYVIPSPNTQKAWGEYSQFFKRLMQEYVSKLDIPVIILGHTRAELNETKGIYEVSVPVKGALKNQGVEAYFSVVVATKKMPIKELEEAEYDADLLHISEEDRALGFKHVFQVRLTRKTTGERLRAPLGMFDKTQVYMDNDVQLLINHLRKYYA